MVGEINGQKICSPQRLITPKCSCIPEGSYLACSMDGEPQPRSNQVNDSPTRLKDALAHVSDYIAEVESKSAPLREVPKTDDHPDFFVPCLYEVPLKDDVYLMDIAPFSLSKTKSTRSLVYELKDKRIEITGNAEYGMATAYDYDIVQHMISYLMEEVNRFKDSLKTESPTDPPPREYAPHIYDLLKFCRRGIGGAQYKVVENALTRLSGTTLKYEAINNQGEREAGVFPLVDGWKVISKTASGEIAHVSIGIPDWIYQGVMNKGKAPSVLTLSQDYFLLKGGANRFLYRYARKVAGKGECNVSAEELHHRSGSKRELKKWINENLKPLVNNDGVGNILEYRVRLWKNKGRSLVTFTYAPDKDK